MDFGLSTLTADTLAQCVTTALSAGFGTWAAFRLETYRDDKRTRDTQLVALRAALFVLTQQRSLLLNFSAQALNPNRHHPARPYVMLPHAVDTLVLTLSFGELVFLLDEDAELLNHLQNADRWFRSTQGLIEVRNHAHSTMQQTLHEALPSVIEATVEQIQQAIGPVIAAKLEQTTDQLFEFTERALSTNKDVFDRLEGVTRRRFPKAPVFAFTEIG